MSLHEGHPTESKMRSEHSLNRTVPRERNHAIESEEKQIVHPFNLIQSKSEQQPREIYRQPIKSEQNLVDYNLQGSYDPYSASYFEDPYYHSRQYMGGQYHNPSDFWPSSRNMYDFRGGESYFFRNAYDDWVDPMYPIYDETMNFPQMGARKAPLPLSHLYSHGFQEDLLHPFARQRGDHYSREDYVSQSFKDITKWKSNRLMINEESTNIASKLDHPAGRAKSFEATINQLEERMNYHRCTCQHAPFLRVSDSPLTVKNKGMLSLQSIEKYIADAQNEIQDTTRKSPTKNQLPKSFEAEVIAYNRRSSPQVHESPHHPIPLQTVPTLHEPSVLQSPNSSLSQQAHDIPVPKSSSAINEDGLIDEKSVMSEVKYRVKDKNLLYQMKQQKKKQATLCQAKDTGKPFFLNFQQRKGPGSPFPRSDSNFPTLRNTESLDTVKDFGETQRKVKVSGEQPHKIHPGKYSLEDYMMTTPEQITKDTISTVSSEKEKPKDRDKGSSMLELLVTDLKPKEPTGQEKQFLKILSSNKVHTDNDEVQVHSQSIHHTKSMNGKLFSLSQPKPNGSDSDESGLDLPAADEVNDSRTISFAEVNAWRSMGSENPFVKYAEKHGVKSHIIQTKRGREKNPVEGGVTNNKKPPENQNKRNTIKEERMEKESKRGPYKRSVVDELSDISGEERKLKGHAIKRMKPNHHESTESNQYADQNVFINNTLFL